jgi:hypothetical protein
MVKNSYKIRGLVMVQELQLQKILLRFINAEFADMHVVYGFCDGTFLAASREYQHLYPNRIRVFENVHRNLRGTAV